MKEKLVIDGWIEETISGTKSYDKRELARKKSEGIVLGRPKGRRSSHVKLSGKENTIADLLSQGVSQTQIAKIFNVNRMTVAKFIKDNQIVQKDL